jgi:hypothetical protein
MHTPWSTALLAPVAALLTACAGTPGPTPPTVPPALQAPAGNSLYLEVLASGVQIYECSRKTDSTYEWAFKAPEATLTDRSGRVLGKHYAGPTWEAGDGSAAVGEVKGRDPGPNPTAIPWLLLAAKSNSGSGTFADARFVQRVATVGGVAPAGGCAESTLRSQARVPYSATYLFYRAQVSEGYAAPAGGSAPRSRY